MKRLIRYLGSIRFALVLIATVTILVILGTFLESLTQSHRYAAQYTYRSPFFLGLLGLFFVNILFSALRRWPFRLRHTAFLITHLGLLMMLLGCMIKSLWGVQGNMGILEGAASKRILLNESPVLYVEKQALGQEGQLIHTQYSIKEPWWGNSPPQLSGGAFPELQLQAVAHYPHSAERLELWVKGEHVFIGGLAPIPLDDVRGNEERAVLRVAMHAQLDQDGPHWQIIALRADSASQLAQRVFIERTQLVLRRPGESEALLRIPLEKALKQGVPVPRGSGDVSVDWEAKTLSCRWKHPVEGRSEQTRLSLQPEAFGCNERLDFPMSGAPPYLIDLELPPTLLIVQNDLGEENLYAFDRYGAVHHERFSPHELKRFIVYEGGFGGYGCSLTLPFFTSPHHRKDAELARALALTEHLKEAIAEHSRLSPPLQLLRQAAESQGVDFAHCLSSFLEEWRLSGQWLYPTTRPLAPPLDRVIASLDWEHEWLLAHGAQWVSVLHAELLPRMEQGEDLFSLLKEMSWPLLRGMKTPHSSERSERENSAEYLTLFAEQILQVSEQLPSPPAAPVQERGAHYLSALLRGYGLHSDTLSAGISSEQINACLEAATSQPVSRGILIETAITARRKALAPLRILEDNLPLLVVDVSDGQESERIALSYDSYGAGLKWPVLNGRYLLRFQPRLQALPYRLRLRDTRQINYAASGQAYAYESDIVISPLEAKPSFWDRMLQAVNLEPRPLGGDCETTISMNNVYETWDGYRFYMANISPPQEVAAQRAQIVVNCDPAKYRLTYPGAFLVALGIFLLFWVYAPKK